MSFRKDSQSGPWGRPREAGNEMLHSLGSSTPYSHGNVAYTQPVPLVYSDDFPSTAGSHATRHNFPSSGGSLSYPLRNVERHEIMQRGPSYSFNQPRLGEPYKESMIEPHHAGSDYHFRQMPYPADMADITTREQDRRRRTPPEYINMENYDHAMRIQSDLGQMEGPSKSSTGQPKHSQRKSSHKDEFDGPIQYLPKPRDAVIYTEDQLIKLQCSLLVPEQDRILNKVNDCLSRCAFDFMAKYQFPIPIEADKRQVVKPDDREWTEWVHLLKRLATKRRIPHRVVYNGQIKQLVTILENSLEMRHAAKHQSRPQKDDRNVLQLVSAGIQVAKILKDADAMEYINMLYTETEELINNRQGSFGHE